MTGCLRSAFRLREHVDSRFLVQLVEPDGRWGPKINMGPHKRYFADPRFKIRNGQILQIEALDAPVSYGMPTGWGGKASVKE